MNHNRSKTNSNYSMENCGIWVCLKMILIRHPIYIPILSIYGMFKRGKIWHGPSSLGYPLVNVYITWKDPPCWRVNPLFLWPFSIANCWVTRGYDNGTMGGMKKTSHSLSQAARHGGSWIIPFLWLKIQTKQMQNKNHQPVIIMFEYLHYI